MSVIHLLHAARYAAVLTLTIALLGLFSYMALEPTVSRSATSGPFTVTQTVTDEISFLVDMPDVTMVGSISGLTGGHATGAGQAVVQTNDPDGYNMTIAFSTGTPMRGDSTNGVIDNYTPSAAGTPDYTWADNSSGGAAQFGYTVNASTSVDVAQAFKDNNTDCDAGTNVTVDRCWMNASTSDFTIINRTSGSADTGATTTLKFRVHIPSNPSPSVPADTYVATATLTALNN